MRSFLWPIIAHLLPIIASVLCICSLQTRLSTCESLPSRAVAYCKFPGAEHSGTNVANYLINECPPLPRRIAFLPASEYPNSLSRRLVDPRDVPKTCSQILLSATCMSAIQSVFNETAGKISAQRLFQHLQR